MLTPTSLRWFNTANNPEAFVFAGFMGSVPAWEHFAHEWDRLLRESPVLTAKGFKNLLRRKRDSPRVLKFVEVLKDCEVYRVSVIIPRKAFQDGVIAELPKWQSRGLAEDAVSLFRNEYYFGFFATIMSILIPMAQVAKKSTKLEVVYDLNIQEVENLKTGYRDFLTNVPDVAARLAQEPHGETDDDFMPLQAADLVSWHIHRDFFERQHGREHIDSVWSALKELNTYPPIVLGEADLRRACWNRLDQILG